MVFSAGAALAAAPAAAPATPTPCAVLEIDAIGHRRLAELESWPGLESWAEADGELLACGPAPVLDAMGQRARPVRRYEDVEPSWLGLILRAHRDDLAVPGVRTLLAGGRLAVVEVSPGADLAAPWHPAHAAVPGGPGPETVGAALRPFVSGAVLARQAANLPPAPPLPALRQAAAARLAEAVDGDRWLATDVTLAGFHRHTKGPGIAAARDWLVAQLAAMPGLAVETQSFDVTGTTAWNVVATLPGTTRPDDWYLVGAHYDARVTPLSDTTTPAPGAEDNGSGCAGVLELARVFTAHPPEGTMIFLCFSGEEEGLFGSWDHSSRLVASGDDARVRAMVNMDMIGYTADGDLDCLIESEPLAQPLVDALVGAAAANTSLRIVTSVCSTCAWGSDHVPYLDRGMPAVLAIENDWNQYPHYHQATDLPGNLTLAMGTEVLRMNAAALAVLAGAGQPLFADGFESGDLAAWSAAVP